MKKCVLLVLVAALAAVTAFALEGIGDLEAGVELSVPNAGGGNNEKASIGIEPFFTYSNTFGALGLEATIGDYVEITTEDVDDKLADDLYLEVTPSYSLEAGPGTLSFALTLKPVFHLVYYGSDDLPGPDILFNPMINYSLNPGFGLLSFELGASDEYPGLFSGHGLGMIDGENEEGDGYGLVLDDLYFKAGLAMDNGLSFWLSPRFYIAMKDGRDTELTYLRLDVSYTLQEPAITFGLEAGIPTMEDGLKHLGLTLTPHVNAAFGALKAWFALQLDGLANDVEADLVITPVLGVSYSF